MKRRFITLAVALLITFSGCSPSAPQPLPPTEKPLPEPTAAVFASATAAATATALPPTATPTETPASAPINTETLKDFTYWLTDFNTPAALADGVFDNGQLQVRLIDPIATGDLNGDAQADAAVMLAIKSGGTGTFFHLVALLNQNGTLTQSASTYIGDRQGIQNLSIEDGRIILDYYTQGRKDPLCCASEHRLRSYILEDSALRLTGEQVLDGPGAQATPLPVAILIDQPGESQPLASPLQVRGRVNPVPPEGKLAYAVTDMNANLLAQGAFPVTGAPGGPGTFDFDIPLQTLSPGLVQVEIIDAADGILRGRSVVTLVAQ